MGIKDRGTEMEIPFELEGTIVRFESETPTTDDLHHLPHIILTSDSTWDPGAVELRPKGDEDTM